MATPAIHSISTRLRLNPPSRMFRKPKPRPPVPPRVLVGAVNTSVAGGVGSLGVATPEPESFRILTEAGGNLTTQSGSALRTE